MQNPMGFLAEIGDVGDVDPHASQVPDQSGQLFALAFVGPMESDGIREHPRRPSRRARRTQDAGHHHHSLQRAHHALLRVIHTALRVIHTALRVIHTALRVIHTALRVIHTALRAWG
ncbi:MAG: hypothetical protein V9E98_07200 [Candidatus Nanopelagicales bacterium]